MPYGTRKRTFRKRRSTRKGRTVAKRRKVAFTRRLAYRRKLVPKRMGTKWVRKARRGAGATVGNKYIHNANMGTLTWQQPVNSAFNLAAGIHYGRVVLMPNHVCLSGLLGGSLSVVTVENLDVYTPDQMNKYAARFQAAKVMYAQITAEFYIENDSEFVANSDRMKVGIYLSEKEITHNPLTTLCDWEDMRKAGNYVVREYTKNVSGPLKIKMNVNVPRCIQALNNEDTYCRVWPTNFIDRKERIADCYPNEPDLYAYAFIVPQTRSLSTGSPVNINYRMGVTKKVLFRRPITNILQVVGLDQYPAFQPALPSTYAPRPLYPPRELDAQVDELEARMDEDDQEDDALVSTVNFLNAQTGALTTTTGQLSDDVADLQVFDQQVQNQLTSLNQETTDLQHQIDVDVGNLAYHAALAANQAHG